MSDNPFKDGILPCSNLEILCKDYIKELEQQLSDQDRVLRATVPERHKSASSPVGCVQNYIGELEQQLSNSISKDELRGLMKEFYIRDVNRNRTGAVNFLLSALNKLIEGGSNE